MDMKRYLKELKIKAFIRTSWWKFLLIFSIGSLLIIYFGKLKTRLKDSEIIHLFASTELVDSNFNRDFYNKFNSDDGIVEVNTTAVNFSDQRFNSTYQSTFSIDADIFLVSETFLKSEYAEIFEISMYKFNENEINFLETNLKTTFYKFENWQIGVKVFDINDDSYNKYNINKYYTFDENYFIFIDNTSTNLNTFNDNGFTVCFQSIINLLTL